MPALYEQLPSQLDIVVTHGDALAAVVYENTVAGIDNHLQATRGIA